MRFIFRVEFAVRQGDIMLQAAKREPPAKIAGARALDPRPPRRARTSLATRTRLPFCLQVCSPGPLVGNTTPCRLHERRCVAF